MIKYIKYNTEYILVTDPEYPCLCFLNNDRGHTVRPLIQTHPHTPPQSDLDEVLSGGTASSG